MHAKLVAALVVVALTAAALCATAAEAAAPTVWTTVDRNVTVTQYFPPDPNDPCGFPGVTEIKHYTIAMEHLTQNADGSFHYIDFETGTVTLDWDDPTIPDVTLRLTNTFEVNVTPGEIITLSETYRQGGRTFRVREHLQIVVTKGTPRVERWTIYFSPCP